MNYLNKISSNQIEIKVFFSLPNLSDFFEIFCSLFLIRTFTIDLLESIHLCVLLLGFTALCLQFQSLFFSLCLINRFQVFGWHSIVRNRSLLICLILLDVRNLFFKSLFFHFHLMGEKSLIFLWKVFIQISWDTIPLFS